MLAFILLIVIGLLSNKLHAHPSNILRSQFRRQGTTYTDAFDHTWIKEWAAIGDSYSSGIGVGKPLHWGCSRYDAAYPMLINNDESLGDGKRNLNFLACLGHKTSDIVNKQLSKLEKKQDLITLTAGGNDVGFSQVVDACIYGIRYTNCQEYADRAKKAIESDEFSKGLANLIHETTGKLFSSNSRVFWLLYTPFFDISDNLCNTVYWNYRGKAMYLDEARRGLLDDLVSQTNDKIKEAAKNEGDQVVIVDWESGIDLMKGKICSEGTDETWKNGDNREALAFYELHSTLDDKAWGNAGVAENWSVGDAGNNDIDVTTWDGDKVGPYEASIAKEIEDAMKADGATLDSYMKTIEGMTSETVSKDDTGKVAGILAERAARVFHPQSNGHMVMAYAVLTALEQEQAKALDQEAATTTAVGCPAPTGFISYPGAWDICYNEHPWKHQVTFRRDDAITRINEYCDDYAGQEIDSSRSEVLRKKLYGPDNHFMNIKVSQRSDGVCEPIKEGYTWSISDTECKRYLTASMDSCDTSTQDEKQGGIYVSECLAYTVYVQDTPYLQTTDVNGGKLSCASEVIDAKQGDSSAYFSLEEAHDAVDEFCKHIDDSDIGRAIGDSVDEDPDTIPIHSEIIPECVISRLPGVTGVPGATAVTSLPGILKRDEDECSKNLKAILDNCDTTQEDGNSLWKAGGSLVKDCTNWRIGLVPTFN